MSSIYPEQYMDAADIRMLRDILKRSGYRLAGGGAETKRSRSAAMFVIGQFKAGLIEPSFMLHGLEHRAYHPRQAADDTGLQVWENEGGATKGDAI